MNRLPILLLLAALAAVSPLCADDFEVVINGVEGEVLENVRTRVQPFRLGSNVRLSRRALESRRQDAVRRARSALRPFGYYHSTITASTRASGERAWTLTIDIEPGPPMLVETIDVELLGPGAGRAELLDWKEAFPLAAGQRLVQPDWDRAKERALEIAEDHGFLNATFTRHRIELDLERNRARLDLALETGERAVMGSVTFEQDIVLPRVMENLPRFSPGDPYSSWIQEKFRIDIWQTGYFGRIEVTEDRHLEESPPRVDLVVKLEPRKPNTYQGAVGVGSDTGPRMHFSWSRHVLSRRGDSLRVGLGWQQHNDEFFLRGNYRIPRREKAKQFWTVEALFKRETEDLKVRASDVGDDFVTLATADINDYSLRMGRLRIWDRRSGFERLFETLYAQLVRESSDYRLNPTDPEDALLLPGTEAGDALARNHSSLAFGIDLSLPVIHGNGWEAVGHNQRGWLFTANEAWGSDSDFTQAYLSTRWALPWGDDWKFLLRGEVGWSDAAVKEIDITVEGQPIQLSVTDLPNLYRFKAGGSASVRGYGFERLSNNGIGSNNIVTASMEAERRFLENWSAAAFFDVGNAFNDWGQMDLKRGVGVGIRWYTIAGAMRLDFAKALDLDGEPWRIHFTIGTTLL